MAGKVSVDCVSSAFHIQGELDPCAPGPRIPQMARVATVRVRGEKSR